MLQPMVDYGQKIEEKSRPVSFKRSTGLFGAVTLGVGSLMGAGLYVLVGVAAAEAGPGLWIAYAVCGLLTFLSVLMYAELSRALPVSGGGYVYAYRKLGSFWGFQVGWNLAVGSIFACALYAVGFSAYLSAFLHLDPAPQWFIRTAAVTLVALLTAAALRGGKGGGRLQIFFTWGNLLVVCIFIGVAFLGFDSDNLAPMLPNGFSGVGGAVSLIYISFFGYQLIANTSEEITEAEKTVPRAMIISLAVAFVAYLLTAIAAVSAVPWQELAASDAPLTLVAERSIGQTGVYLIGFGALLASIAALNGTLISQGRQIFAMGRDRIVPDFLAAVTRRTGVPAAALITGAGITTIVILTASLTFAAKAANFALLFSMLPLSTALHLLYKEHVADGETISFWKRALPFATLAANAGLLLTLDYEALTFGGTIVGAGCIVFFTYSYSAEKRGRAGISLNLSEDGGGFRFGGEKILVPMANPKTQQHLFHLAESLAVAQDAKIMVLTVIVADEGQSPREALSRNSRIGNAVQVLDGAAKLAQKEDTAFTPLVRAAKSLTAGILDAAEEERAKLLVMGWSSTEDGTPTPIVNKVVQSCRANLAFVHIKDTPADTGDKYLRVGVALGAQGNSALMQQLASAMVSEAEGRIYYFSVLSPYADKAELTHAREMHTAALSAHESPVPFTAEILQAGNPLKAIIEKTRHLDLLIIGAGALRPTGGETVGTFASAIARDSHCSVILVRRERRIPSFIPRPPLKERR